MASFLYALLNKKHADYDGVNILKVFHFTISVKKGPQVTTPQSICQ